MKELFAQGGITLPLSQASYFIVWNDDWTACRIVNTCYRIPL